MNRMKQIAKLSLLVLMLEYGCKTSVVSKEVDELALFTTIEIFESTSLSYKPVPSVERLISIPKNEPLEKKISPLFDSVSNNSFHNLTIEV